MKSRRIRVLLAAVGGLAATAAGAATFDLVAEIDGPQAGTGSSATGSATMTYDDVTNMFSWNIEWTLEGNITVAHFHGPAEPGVGAGVQVDIGAISGLVSPSIGGTTISDPQEADLLAGLWYINIHSNLAPGGEIRGQVEMAPADTDADGVADAVDNCTLVANPDQTDADNDGFGNNCDPDLDNNLLVDFQDLQLLKAVFFSADPVADFNVSGGVDFADLQIMKGLFFGPPGPAATPPAGPTYTDDVQPIFFEKCDSCHTGLGLGGHNIGISYADTLLPSGACPGLLIGECALVRIQDGSMPLGGGCTGNPAMDAGNANCLTAEEQDTVQAWIDAGLPE